MAVFTKHPVSAPPAAPVREKTRHLMLRAWCTFALFTAIAASGWSELLGTVGLGILVTATGAISVVVWILAARARDADDDRPRFAVRRLPWLALCYAAWAAVSILWSVWPDATALTWYGLAVTTLVGLFLASVLTWRELVRAIASALKWVLSLSLLLEAFVALVLRHPLLPDDVTVPAKIPAELYWVRGNLFGTGRIQGILGNSNLTAMVSMLAIVVFAILIAAKAARRGWLIAWIVLAMFLLVRSSSATVYLAGAASAVVLGATLLMRRARTPRARTQRYVLFAVIGVAGGILAWVYRDAIFTVLGRSGDATGRGTIWAAVLERAWQRPVAGWGFSTPWLPWEPAIKGWIIDHHLTVFMAHNMWLDAFFQLGFVGVVLLGLMYLAFIWRSWFFAVDRPRWDLVADRPYSPLTLLPILVATLLLVQGLAESRPLMEWGWMFAVMLVFKIKLAPIVGVGPAERSIAMERGDLVTPIPRAGARPGGTAS